MLPQRDISRLTNRLYQEAVAKLGKKLARRVPEAVIERDYVLAWLLTQIGLTLGHVILAFLKVFKRQPTFVVDTLFARA